MYLSLIAAGAQAPTAPATPDSTPAATPAAAPAAAPTWSLGSVDFSGYLDGYYSYNANRPGQNSSFGQINQLYNFNDQTDQFSLEAAKLTINHDPDPVGAHVDFIFGRTNAFLHGGNDSADSQLHRAGVHQREAAQGQGLRDWTSASSSPPPARKSSRRRTTGTTRTAFLFGYAIPYYHFGVRTSMPVTKTWTVGFQLVNGWNNVTDNNGGVTIGLTSSLVKPKFTWNINYYTGPENYNTQKGYRNLIDTTLLLTPTAEVQRLHQLRLRPEQDPACDCSGEGFTITTCPALAGRGVLGTRAGYAPSTRWRALSSTSDDNQGSPTGTIQQKFTSSPRPMSTSGWKAC